MATMWTVGKLRTWLDQIDAQDDWIITVDAQGRGAEQHIIDGEPVEPAVHPSGTRGRVREITLSTEERADLPGSAGRPAL